MLWIRGLRLGNTCYAALYFSNALALFALGVMAKESRICDVRRAPYHAVGDNVTDDTVAIQNAIDACHLQWPLGATVFLSGPAHYRVTQSLAMTSNMTLLLDDSTSLFSAVTPSMPLRQNPRCPVSYWPGAPTAVVCGTNLSNVAVLGSNVNTSVLDGGGWPWYASMKKNGGGLAGPRMFELAWTNNITLARLTFQWSASWTIHPQFCTGVHAHHLYIHNPRPQGNTDGFDPDSCTDVVLHDTVIDTGDDGISIKSGNSTACRSCHHIQIPSKNTHIYRTKILSRNYCIGSATYGGVEDLVMEDCEIGDDKVALLRPPHLNNLRVKKKHR